MFRRHQQAVLKYDAQMKLAWLATLPLLITLSTATAISQEKPAPPPPTSTQKPATPPPQKPATVPQKRPATPPPAASTTATFTLTDSSGAPVADARVILTGALDRSGSTQSNGIVRFDGLRPGTYRARIEKEGFTTLEREFEWRAGQPPPSPSVTLTPAPKRAEPPPPPAPTKAALPAPGKAVTIALPDFIEKNYITNKEPQKTSDIACSGLAGAELWQIREPLENRQHPGADLMLYVIGGDGTLRLDGRDTNMQAGHFASVPRGSSYSLLRRGRNPNFIVMAILVGEPCS